MALPYRTLHAALQTPWLMHEPALETVFAILTRTNEGEWDTLATQIDKPVEYSRAVTMRGSTAVIPITGPIVRRANLLTRMSGGTSTEELATDLHAALHDPAVRAVVLDIESPGGEANGIHELAEHIYAARGDKPIIAYVGHIAASAAYWIASAADSIVIDPTASLGSIGVYAAMRVEDDEQLIEFVSSQSPRKRLHPATEEGRTTMQAWVDDLAQVFVDRVARNRAVAVTTVTEDFGRGGLLVGARAVAAGMADRIGSLEEVLATLHAAPTVAPSYKDVSMQNPVLSAEAVRAWLGLNDKPATLEAADEPLAPFPVDPPAETIAEGVSVVEQAKEVAAMQDNDALAALQAQLEEATAALAAEREAKAALEAAARTRRLEAMADGWPNAEAHVKVMNTLATLCGEDSEELRTYVQAQRAVGAQTEYAALLSEQGSDASGDTAPAATLEAKIKKLQADDPNLSYHQAYAQAVDAALYDELEDA